MLNTCWSGLCTAPGPGKARKATSHSSEWARSPRITASSAECLGLRPHTPAALALGLLVAVGKAAALLIPREAAGAAAATAAATPARLIELPARQGRGDLSSGLVALGAAFVQGAEFQARSRSNCAPPLCTRHPHPHDQSAHLPPRPPPLPYCWPWPWPWP